MAVLEEVREWQNRPLDPVYPLVIFDALRVKIRDEGVVKNKAVLLGLGHERGRDQGGPGPMDRADRRGPNSGCGVMTELKNRGVADILIAAVDGLKGLPRGY